MTTAKEHMAADMAYVLADTDEGADEFTWDGETYTGTVVKAVQGDIGHYESLAVERCTVTTAALGFPSVFPGMAVGFSSESITGGQWEVDEVGTVPGSLVIQLMRNIS